MQSNKGVFLIDSNTNKISLIHNNKHGDTGIFIEKTNEQVIIHTS
jgi:uncharacterized protein YjfI (DUF2170 family)